MRIVELLPSFHGSDILYLVHVGLFLIENVSFLTVIFSAGSQQDTFCLAHHHYIHVCQRETYVEA